MSKETKRRGCGNFKFTWDEETEAIIRDKANTMKMSVSEYIRFCCIHFPIERFFKVISDMEN